METLLKTDLYELLQISPDAEEKEIKSAYRKKALTCHPDKNPDNPKAAELFQELSRALEILTDKEAKAVYDKVLRARQAAKVRNRELDAKRRKLKEDLEAREQQALNRKVDEIDAAKQLEKEIERLRKEGSKKLEEERELLRQQIAEELGQKSQPSKWLPRLKVKWNVEKGDVEDTEYDEGTLRKMFSKYGVVTCLVVSSKKKGSALVEFETTTAANLALKMEQGRPECPLSVAWAQEPPTKPTPATTTRPLTGQKDELDYENAVLMRLRQAQERRNLSEKVASEGT